MRREYDRAWVLLDHPLPPTECLPTDHASRVSAPRPTPGPLRGLVDVTHHQEEQVANAKGVALPRAFDRESALAGVDVRGLSVLAGWIYPFSEPPCLRFVESISVVVPRNVVDVFAPMRFQD